MLTKYIFWDALYGEVYDPVETEEYKQCPRPQWVFLNLGDIATSIRESIDMPLGTFQ